MMHSFPKANRKAAAQAIIQAEIAALTNVWQQVWISQIDGTPMTQARIPDCDAFKYLEPQNHWLAWNADRRKSIRELQAMQREAPMDERFENDSFDSWIEWYIAAKFIDEIRWI